MFIIKNRSVTPSPSDLSHDLDYHPVQHCEPDLQALLKVKIGTGPREIKQFIATPEPAIS
jgi:hypothetical protein